ncbi:peptidoglycan-binding protein [Streptomyces sp. NPDC015171]|uniref:peptidoglycan-binding domain-containing protein n=1 Tax=Streptomyces sp. NPDC015171 TaxID=3364945 RepID=UPI0036FA0E4C
MPIPPDPEQPPPEPDLEPIRVQRPRRFDALAELMREIRPDPVTYQPLNTSPGTPPGTVPGTPSGSRPGSQPGTGHAAPGAAEEDTQELWPVRPARGPDARPASPSPRAAGRIRPRPGPRRAAVALTVLGAALVGFGCALLLPGRQQAAATDRPSPPAATKPSAPTPSAATDPDGPGTLRQGDTGPYVVDLQQRLLHIPDVYHGGSTTGAYDATLTAAVARFQLWYGISGDERGVYGDDTRRALESRTRVGDDA